MSDDIESAFEALRADVQRLVTPPPVSVLRRRVHRRRTVNAVAGLAVVAVVAGSGVAVARLGHDSSAPAVTPVATPRIPLTTGLPSVTTTAAAPSTGRADPSATSAASTMTEPAPRRTTPHPATTAAAVVTSAAVVTTPPPPPLPLSASALLTLAELPTGYWGTAWGEVLDPTKLKDNNPLSDFPCQRRVTVEPRPSDELRRLYDDVEPSARTAVERVEVAPDVDTAVQALATLRIWLTDCRPDGAASIPQRLHLAELVDVDGGGAVYVNRTSVDTLANAVGIGRVGRAIVVLSVIRDRPPNETPDASPVAATLRAAMARLVSQGY